MSLDARLRTANGALVRLLSSRAHWLASFGLAVATVTGRRSGRRYRIPVGYQRVPGGLLIMVSHARRKQWWRNYLGGGPIDLRVRGRELRGWARVIDPASDEFRMRAEATLRRLPFLAAQFGIARRRGEPLDAQQWRVLAREIVAVHVDVLEPRAGVRWHALRPVGMDFLASAPLRAVVECTTSAPRAQVWRAFSDPATWPEWFPGVESAAYPDQAPPYGVGTRRVASVRGRWMDETIVAWQEPRLWAYCITRSSARLARAQLEATELEQHGAGTLVRWTLASEPLGWLRVSAPLLPRVLEALLARALRNLEARLARAGASEARSEP
jgi:carbon monoxide dehydrogenase subunit G